MWDKMAGMDEERDLDFRTPIKRSISEPALARSASMISLSLSWTRKSALHGFGGTTVLKRKKMTGKGGVTRSTSETKHGFGGVHSSRKGPSRETVNKLVEEDTVAIGLKYSQLYLKHRLRAASDNGENRLCNFPTIEESSPFDSLEDLRDTAHASPARSVGADSETKGSSDEIPAFKQTQYWSGFLRGVYPNSLSVDSIAGDFVSEAENVEPSAKVTSISSEQTTLGSSDVSDVDNHGLEPLRSSSANQAEYLDELTHRTDNTVSSPNSPSTENGNLVESSRQEENSRSIDPNVLGLNTNGKDSDEIWGNSSEGLDSDSASMESDFAQFSENDTNNDNRHSDILSDLSDLKQFDMPARHLKSNQNVMDKNKGLESLEMAQLKESDTLPLTEQNTEKDSAVFSKTNDTTENENVDDSLNGNGFPSPNYSQNSEHPDNGDIVKSETSNELGNETTIPPLDAIQNVQPFADIKSSEIILDSLDKSRNSYKSESGSEELAVVSSNDFLRENDPSEASSELSVSDAVVTKRTRQASLDHVDQEEKLDPQAQYSSLIIPPYLDKGLLSESDVSLESNNSDSLENIAETEGERLENPDTDTFTSERPVTLAQSDEEESVLEDTEFRKAFDTSSIRSLSASENSATESFPLKTIHGENSAIDKRYTSVEDLTSL